MKNIFENIVALILLLAGFASCDYLDVVPDNVATIDMAFQDKKSAEKFLFTCYNAVPPIGNPNSDPAYIGGYEMTTYTGGGSFLNRGTLGIVRGGQNTTNPIFDEWNGNIYKGIRNCNILLERIDEVYDMNDFEKARWKAEAKFIKAYLHFYLMRMYGPIVIVDENLPVSATPDEVRAYRSPFDECVTYVSSLLDEAAKDLPVRFSNNVEEMGRATKQMAYAIKAKLLIMAASPLFNGNADYAGIVDNKGVKLFNSEYSEQKWVDALEACKVAIDTAHYAGAALYEKTVSQFQLNDFLKKQVELRDIMHDKWNPETIWGGLKGDFWRRQTVSMPRLDVQWTTNTNVWNALAPTIRLAENYYSSRGVPIEEDTQFEYDTRYQIKVAEDNDKWMVQKGYETAKVNYDREARYYANIGFDGAVWFGNGRTDINQELWTLKTKFKETAGLSAWEAFSITGMYAKKLVDYRTAVSKTSFTIETGTPWPIIRLADLYLLYAEASNEVNGPGEDAYKYLDMVRARAGLEDVLSAWSKYSKYPVKPTTKDGLRQIIKRERMIELAMECQLMWDNRRWKTSTDLLNGQIYSYNVRAESASEFSKIVPIDGGNQVFGIKDYLWPISDYARIINPNLVQNYGW